MGHALKGKSHPWLTPPPFLLSLLPPPPRPARVDVLEAEAVDEA